MTMIDSISPTISLADEALISNWIMDSMGSMQLTADDLAFLKQHDLCISTAYIGMVRVYANRNRCIAQSSAWASMLSASDQSFDLVKMIPHLREQTQQYVARLRAMSAADLERELAGESFQGLLGTDNLGASA
jgi:hypothetical protein